MDTLTHTLMCIFILPKVALQRSSRWCHAGSWQPDGVGTIRPAVAQPQERVTDRERGGEEERRREGEEGLCCFWGAERNTNPCSPSPPFTSTSNSATTGSTRTLLPVSSFEMRGLLLQGQRKSDMSVHW